MISISISSFSGVWNQVFKNVHNLEEIQFFNSIQFYLYSAFNKGALSQSCFTENQPLMSKPRATVARKNSLADNRKKP